MSLASQRANGLARAQRRSASTSENQLLRGLHRCHLISVTRTRNGKHKSTRRRPILESLEERIQLSTFRVNTTLDTVAVNLKNGKDSTGHISLRSAIMAADSHKGSNTIIVPAGTFTLTIPGANEDADATGDLDVKGKITIKGAGSTNTIVNGNSLDRVFEVLSGNVTIQKLTIEGGLASEGAGLLNLGGKVTLSSVVVAGNTAQGTAGTNGVQGSGGAAPLEATAAPASTDQRVKGAAFSTRRAR